MMIGTALLDGLWQGVFVVAIAAAATALVPQRSAATRYAIWFSALLALAVLPVVTLWRPAPPEGLFPMVVVHTAAATSRVTQQAANASGTWLIFLWLAGVAAGLARLLVSAARIANIARNAVPAPELGERVMLTDDITVPLAARVFSPVILVPRHYATLLDRADLASIIAHERAHIRRGDVATNVVQRLLEALLFFNPWAHAIGNRLVKERESACDDWVVASADAAERYAACLARLAEKARLSRVPLLTPSAMGPKRMLLARITRLLDRQTPQLGVNYLVISVTIAAFALVGIVLTTSNGLAAVGNVVAAASCKTPNAGASVLDPVPPKVPKSARSVLVAEVAVTVAPSGSVSNVKVIESSGNAEFDRDVADAALHSKYSPKIVACTAVTGVYVFRAQARPDVR
jgi:bla regulator protein BlaR1